MLRVSISALLYSSLAFPINAIIISMYNNATHMINGNSSASTHNVSQSIALYLREPH